MSKGTLPKILLKFWDAIGSDRSAILRTKVLLISCLRLFGSNDIRHQVTQRWTWPRRRLKRAYSHWRTMDIPKRARSAAPNFSDAKRIKLTIPHQNQEQPQSTPKTYLVNVQSWTRTLRRHREPNNWGSGSLRSFNPWAIMNKWSHDAAVTT